MKTFIVKCTIEVPVKVEDNYYNEEFTPEFDLEQNHCPATGLVGIAIDKAIREGDKDKMCWGCALKGKCEIINEIP